jgi:hypothetical protein
LDIAGVAHLAVDALGPSDFRRALDSKDTFEVHAVNSNFTAEISSLTVCLVVCLFGLARGLVLLPASLAGLALLLAPVAYPAWRVSAWLAEMLQRFVQSMSPGNLPVWARARIGCVLGFVLFVPWFVVLAIAFCIHIAIRFGLDLPPRWLAERVIIPPVLSVFRRLAELEETDRRWGFRRLAFRGLVLLVLGFAYQVAGTLWHFWVR